MVHVTKEKLIIEFEHPFPKELLFDLKLAMVNALKHQWLDVGEIAEADAKQANFWLSELLKVFLQVKE